MNDDISPPTFQFTPRAISAIHELRPQFEAKAEQKSGAVFVAWGTSIPHDGSPGYSAIVISFYTESQMAEMAQHVRMIDGLEVVTFLLPDNYPRFEGQTIDFQPDRGFFFAPK